MNRSTRIILGVFVLVAVAVLLYAKHAYHNSSPQRAQQNPSAPVVPQTVTPVSKTESRADKAATTSSAAAPVLQKEYGAAPQPQPVPTTGGLVAVIDPATGQLREADATDIGGLAPQPALQRRTLTLAAPATIEPQTFAGPGGSVGVVLGEDAMSFMVVTKGPDGTLSADCVDGKKAADAKIQAAKRHKVKKQAETKTQPAQREATDEM
ncbi:MAG TPA: hypothetical protein VKD70_15440 [Candidatus Acidoferrum sp.]|nr:hypothetical protein [Candidatus Acidoferrum sp.]